MRADDKSTLWWLAVSGLAVVFGLVYWTYASRVQNTADTILRVEHTLHDRYPDEASSPKGFGRPGTKIVLPKVLYPITNVPGTGLSIVVGKEPHQLILRVAPPRLVSCEDVANYLTTLGDDWWTLSYTCNGGKKLVLVMD